MGPLYFRPTLILRLGTPLMFAPLFATDPAFARLRSACIAILLALTLGACQSGCVRRRMMIRTNPPGALVYVDDYEIGTTPIAKDFTYYGKRKIRLVKDGYETLTVMQSVPTPWYQIPPLDFVAENLVPGTIRDQRTFNYVLNPQTVVPSDQLLSRAENLRRGISSASIAAPAAPISPAGPTSAAGGPPIFPPPRAAEPIPTPEGLGGQPVYPLSPGGR